MRISLFQSHAAFKLEALVHSFLFKYWSFRQYPLAEGHHPITGLPAAEPLPITGAALGFQSEFASDYPHFYNAAFLSNLQDVAVLEQATSRNLDNVAFWGMASNFFGEVHLAAAELDHKHAPLMKIEQLRCLPRSTAPAVEDTSAKKPALLETTGAVVPDQSSYSATSTDLVDMASEQSDEAVAPGSAPASLAKPVAVTLAPRGSYGSAEWVDSIQTLLAQQGFHFS